MDKKIKIKSAPFLQSIFILFLAVTSLQYRQKNIILTSQLSEYVHTQAGLETVKTVFPEAAEIDYSYAPSTASKVKDRSGSVLGSFLTSSPWCDNIKGYAGHVPVLIAMNNDLIIKEIIPLQNNETRSFMARINNQNFFSQWKGVHINEAPAKEIDIITRATVSCAAFIETVQKRTALFTDTEARTAFDLRYLLRQIIALLFILPGLAGTLIPSFGRKYRTLILTANVIVLGLITGTVLSIGFIQGIMLHGFNFVRQWHLVVLLASVIIIGVTQGKNAYCAFICPYGSAQELTGKINRKPVLKINPGRHILLKHSRAILLLIFFGALLYADRIDADSYEPFSAFIISSAPLSSVILAVSFLLISVLRPRLWCSLLCPTGKLLDMIKLKRKSFIRERGKNDKA